MNNYNLWLEMQNHPELRKALDYVRKIEIERDNALLRVAELNILVLELLWEYKAAKLRVIDEFVKPDYYDEAVAELNERIAAYRVRAALKREE